MIAGWNQSRETWAVVTAPRVEARSAPSDDSGVAFTAPEGQKVAALSESGPWMEIGLPSQGLKGWIKKSDVEPIQLP